MTNLYFVRHAHSTYTPEELKRPLSEQGFKDAQIVTKGLIPEEIDIVVSSPYLRAIQTVEGIAKYINKEIDVIDGFKERKLAESSVKDFSEAITKVWEDENFSWEGGESNIVAQKRGVEATFHVLEKYKGQHIAIGTHGNIMTLIMNYFDKQYDFNFWNNLTMPDIYRLNFEGKELKSVSRLYKE